MISEAEVRAAFHKIGAQITFKDERGRKVVRWALEHPSQVEHDSHDRPLFSRLGTSLRLPYQTPVLDIKKIKEREAFVIDTFDDPAAQVQILDCRPKERHLLVMVKDGYSGRKSNNLTGPRRTPLVCGGDPRKIPVPRMCRMRWKRSNRSL